MEGWKTPASRIEGFTILMSWPKVEDAAEPSDDANTVGRAQQTRQRVPHDF